MLRLLENSHGFKADLFQTERNLKVGIIDSDLLDNGTRHPNLALLKISGYCKGLGHQVRLICDYDELNLAAPFFMQDQDYDVLVLSRVFKFTNLPRSIEEMIAAGYIYWGGTGFDEINGPTLPNEVEHHMPDYHLYDEFIAEEMRKAESMAVIGGRRSLTARNSCQNSKSTQIIVLVLQREVVLENARSA